VTRERQIIVVCTGNICRSPLAEVLLARGLADVDAAVAVTSAGTSPAVGLTPDRHLRRMADDLGVDVSHHLPQPATMALLGRADLVLAATVAHVDEVLWRSPHTPTTTLLAAARRAELIGGNPVPFEQWVRRLTTSVDGSPVCTPPFDDIADPYGGPRRAYRRMAHEVDDAVTRLVRHWCGR
jgi:protein-tyrosine phosphatase